MHIRIGLISAAAWTISVTGAAPQAIAQTTPARMEALRGPPGCVPVAERQMELGCYIIIETALGDLPAVPLYWHLDTYPTHASAEAAKGPRGTVVESMGKVWLFTIAEAGWRPSGGEHVAEIGPLMANSGTKYTASYMEAIMFPGAESSVHHHAGPEALYPLAGEECMETPEGRTIGHAGGPSIIVPGYMPHKLTITGTEKRHSLAIILHDSSQPVAIRTHEHGWSAKELCKG